MPETAWPLESPRPAARLTTQSKPPAFSVVIPTHNRVGIVGRALQSVAAQTFNDYEVVVVDDGSADATPAFLQGVRWPRCRIIRNELPLGVSAARNRGVAATCGEWITFLDDDDELRPDALEALHERGRRTPQLYFLWGGRLIHEMDAADRPIGTREDDWNRITSTVSGSNFLPEILNIATNAAFTIRRSVLEKLGGFDEKLRVSEDRDLFFSLADNGYVGGAVARTIIDVGERYNSLSRSTGLRAGPDIDLAVIEKHSEYLHRSQHRSFLDSYLVTVFCDFLEADNRPSAMRILGELRRRQALSLGVLRKYLRHAPEFRALKELFRYNAIRRLKNRLIKAKNS
jgi:glycosyltransferase involved in cell wall biosynthesis